MTLPCLAMLSTPSHFPHHVGQTNDNEWINISANGWVKLHDNAWVKPGDNRWVKILRMGGSKSVIANTINTSNSKNSVSIENTEVLVECGLAQLRYKENYGNAPDYITGNYWIWHTQLNRWFTPTISRHSEGGDFIVDNFHEGKSLEISQNGERVTPWQATLGDSSVSCANSSISMESTNVLFKCGPIELRYKLSTEKNSGQPQHSIGGIDSTTHDFWVWHTQLNRWFTPTISRHSEGGDFTIEDFDSNESLLISDNGERVSPWEVTLGNSTIDCDMRP